MLTFRRRKILKLYCVIRRMKKIVLTLFVVGFIKFTYIQHDFHSKALKKQLVLSITVVSINKLIYTTHRILSILVYASLD
jgi:hypothetical protein